MISAASADLAIFGYAPDPTEEPMRLFRELARRKLRTTLTILGITIGIWALVVFSSMANKINALVEGGSQYFAGKVLVTDASSIGVAIGTAPMNVDVADQI